MEKEANWRQKMKVCRKCAAKYISVQYMTAIFNKLSSNRKGRNSNMRDHKEGNNEKRK